MSENIRPHLHGTYFVISIFQLMSLVYALHFAVSIVTICAKIRDSLDDSDSFRYTVPDKTRKWLWNNV